MRTAHVVAITTLLMAGAAGAQSQPAHDSAHAAHAEMQKRGAEVMGVDQETSVHVFEAMPNGGIIELQRAGNDTAGTRIIRQHLRSIALAFRQGDFSAPTSIHMTTVPGARTMADRRSYIYYDYRDLPRGGALRITTTDFAARKAIWEFIAYQRNEHMANEARGEPR